MELILQQEDLAGNLGIAVPCKEAGEGNAKETQAFLGPKVLRSRARRGNHHCGAFCKLERVVRRDVKQSRTEKRFNSCVALFVALCFASSLLFRDSLGHVRLRLFCRSVAERGGQANFMCSGSFKVLGGPSHEFHCHFTLCHVRFFTAGMVS